MASENDDETSVDPLKPLFWVAGSRADLRAFPEDVKNVFGFALYQAQQGDKHVAAKPLKGFGGAGVLEIVEDNRGNTYRAVYMVKFAGAVYVLDAFQKKSKHGIRTLKGIVERIKKRLRATERHYRAWSAGEHDEGEEP